MGTLAVDELATARPMVPGEIPVIDFAPFLAGPVAEKRAGRQGNRPGLRGGRVLLPDRPRRRPGRDRPRLRRSAAVLRPAARKAGGNRGDVGLYRGWVPPKEVGEDGRRGGLLETYRLMLRPAAGRPGRPRRQAAAPAQPVACRPARLPGRGGWLHRDAPGGVGRRAACLRPGARPAGDLVRRQVPEAADPAQPAALPAAARPMRRRTRWVPIRTPTKGRSPC